MIAKQRTEAGFSLMEVMVALTILATTAVGVMQLSSGAISGTQQVEQRFLARTVASNQLAELYLNREPLRQGVTSGQETQLGQTFT
ncbi:MAG: type II secretion system minor pseudopilin GspI, partial [Pseudomonadota bacterium]